jgi:L-threonine kinase
MPLTGRIALPGTCGELVQGTLDGIPCLVSCPIERYSVAEVRVNPGPTWTLPAASPKVRAALRAGLAYLGCSERGGQLQVFSDLPRSRGYGSSTADIGATLYALGHAVGHPLLPAEVAGLALQIEPSDSSLFPGLALWDHVHGELFAPLGQPPAMTVVVLDPGGEVDTVAFNQQDHHLALKKLASQHREAFALLQEGVQRSDLEMIGAGTTLSATAHQTILLNPYLPAALHLAHEVGALGICRAHSGTVLGILLDPLCTETSSVVALAMRRFATPLDIFSLPLSSGGPRLLSDTQPYTQVLPSPQPSPPSGARESTYTSHRHNGALDTAGKREADCLGERTGSEFFQAPADPP